VTLRKTRMFEFIESADQHRAAGVRDFRGLNPKSFDGGATFRSASGAHRFPRDRL